MLWIYAWFATSGSFHFGPEVAQRGGHDYDYYALLADAFLDRQLHLQVLPDPRLLALPDPYDSERNKAYRLLDLSLFNGKYYLYFGPAPAVVRAIWTALTGLPVFASVSLLLFGFGSSIWFWLLVHELRNLFSSKIPYGLVLLVYACYGFGGVNAYLLARPSVYHEAILAASFFTLGGMYFWLRALNGNGLSTWQLSLAGFLLAAGVASRVTMVGYAIGPALVLAWRCSRAMRPERKAAVVQMVAYCMPLAMVGCLLLLYNGARFGSFTELGIKYQLTGVSTQPATQNLLYVPHILSAYLFFLPEVIAYFPFQLSSGQDFEVGSLSWGIESPLVSVLLIAPLTILAPLGMALPKRLLRRLPVTRAFVASGVIGLLWSTAVLLMLAKAIGRFLHDVLPVACLLGGLGLWRLYSEARSGRLRMVGFRALAAIFLASSTIVGLTYGTAELSRMAGIGGRSRLDTVRIAYQLDNLSSAALRWVAPGLWPSSYFTDQVGQRREGLFYPANQTLVLPSRGNVPLVQPRAESFFPSTTRISMQIEGETVQEQQLRPGQQSLRWSRPSEGGPVGLLMVRLDFPDEPARSPGSLWPLRIEMETSSLSGVLGSLASDFEGSADRARSQVELVRRAARNLQSLAQQQTTAADQGRAARAPRLQELEEDLMAKDAASQHVEQELREEYEALNQLRGLAQSQGPVLPRLQESLGSADQALRDFEEALLQKRSAVAQAREHVARLSSS